MIRVGERRDEESARKNSLDTTVAVDLDTFVAARHKAIWNTPTGVHNSCLLMRKLVEELLVNVDDWMFIRAVLNTLINTQWLLPAVFL